MARKPQRIGSLRESVRIETRASLTSSGDAVEWDDFTALQFDEGEDVEFDELLVGDGRGNFRGGWSMLGTRRCEVRELRGDEVVLASKLEGRALCYVVMRADDITRAINTDCRLVDVETGRVLNVRHAPPPGRDRFVSLLCESGVAV